MQQERARPINPLQIEEKHHFKKIINKNRMSDFSDLESDLEMQVEQHLSQVDRQIEMENRETR